MIAYPNMIDRKYVIDEVNSISVNFEHGAIIELDLLGMLITECWRNEVVDGKLSSGPEIRTLEILTELIEDGYLNEIKSAAYSQTVVQLPKNNEQIPYDSSN